MPIQSIVQNISTANTRIEMLEGKEHLVVPMVMAGQGVLVGSEGAVFYPKEELSKTPAVWNHKPVVVYHPSMNGQAVSACDQDVINTQKVGLIMNTVYDEATDKLKAEAWLDTSRVDLIDSRITAAIEANQKMEISTGVFIDKDPVPGVFNGTSYSIIARNLRADHLALLPDKIGAYSIAHGGGLLANELSFSKIRDQLSVLLKDKYPWDEETYTPWIADVFDGFVVCEYTTGLWKIAYSKTNDVIALVGNPEEVVRVTEYRTVAGAVVGNSSSIPKERNERIEEMKKAEIVDALISNETTQWKEEDKKFLLTLNEEQLTKMAPVEAKKAPPEKIPANNEEAVKEAVKKGGEGIAPTATKPALNAAEYIEQEVPEGLRDVFRESLAANQAERQRFVTSITANGKNQFSVDELNKMSTASLRRIAALAENEKKEEPQSYYPPVYAGSAAAPTANASKEAPLEVPVMTFE